MATELVKQAQTSLVHFLAAHRDQIEGVLPRHLHKDRVVELIVAQINKTPALMGCTAKSVFNAVMTAGSLGLEIRNGSSYLIPYGEECQLLIDYRGKQELALRSGKVADLDACMVYGRDKFEIRRGVDRCLKHEPYLFTRDDDGMMYPVSDEERGPVVLGYGVAWLKSGETHFDVMSMSDINKIQAQVIAKLEKQKRNVAASPWMAWPEQMQIKTVMHRLCKRIPQSPELMKSQEVDECAISGKPLDAVVDIEMTDIDRPLIEGGSGLAKLAQDHGLLDKLPPGFTHDDLAALLGKCPKCKATMPKADIDRHKETCGKPKGTVKLARHFDSFDEAPSPEAPDQCIYVGQVLYRANPEATAWVEAKQ